MKRSSSMIFILLFLFVTLIHLLAVTSLKAPTLQTEMDYYEFTQHWPGTMEDKVDTELTEKPGTSTGSKSNTKNKQQPTTSTTAGKQKNPKAAAMEDKVDTEQTEEPSTSSGSKSNTKNKQQPMASTTAGKQKNPKAAAGNKNTVLGLLTGFWNKKTPTLILRPDRIEDFGIHGLWPQYYNDPYPEYCLKQDGTLHETYDFSKMEDLYDELKKHWHSMASPYEDGHAPKSQNRFGNEKTGKPGIWRHEWDKHGTCSFFEHQREYFENALELKKNRISNLLDILYHEKIKPDGSSYPWDRIRDALKDKIKVMPIIECNAKNELYQVHICLTKEDLELMDCIGDTVLCDKSREIIFPSFPKKVNDDKEL